MIGNAGQPVKNQFVVTDGDKTWFQSYDTIIAIIDNGQVILDQNKWDFSKTTGKYRNVFLGEKKQETERKIKQGIYKLVDLNKN